MITVFVLTRVDYGALGEFTGEEIFEALVEGPLVFASWEGAAAYVDRDWRRTYDHVADRDNPDAPPIRWEGDVAPVDGAIWEARTEVLEITYRVTLRRLQP